MGRSKTRVGGGGRLRLWRVAGGCAAALLLVMSPAHADDVADEADLLFRLGAAHYQQGEFEEATQHFLASNRLAPNRNVIFNAARCYERLGLFPEAFRYYLQSRDGEQDAGALTRIEEALARIRPEIAVLEITTEPANATLYLDRKDLGARGSSPLTLGVAPGTYAVLAELPGHHPVTVTVEAATRGSARSLHLRLEPILGTLAVRGTPPGTRVSRDGAPPQLLCRAPCELRLPPGEHALLVESPRHLPRRVTAVVEADRKTELVPELTVATGSLTVSTDEPGALVEVDGKAVGFTPLVTTVPVGEHRVRVSERGFRVIERTLTITQQHDARLDAELVRSEEVTAASRVTETVSEAPASVSIVSRDELKAFAYPTIVESLRGLRGVFVWNDRSYPAAGVRGPGFLGSYGNRLLVLSDGQPTNDNWVGSSYIGYDARTDLADLERIELVRGPGSVLYGTNAIYGVVNLVGRTRDVARGAEVGVAAEGEQLGRARARVDWHPTQDSGVWFSVSAARADGAELHFPEYESPSEDGVARNADDLDSRTAQGRAYFRWLSIQWFHHEHDKELPTAPFETRFGDVGTRQVDRRSFLEVKAEPWLSRRLQWMSRAHLNRAEFDGRYVREEASGGVEQDSYLGHWLGLEERFVWLPFDGTRITLGGEAQFHTQVEQTARDEAGQWLDSDDPYQVGAAYGLLDTRVHPRVRLSAGTRLDAYSSVGLAVSPRLAVILKPYETGTLKVLGGRAFRAPSAYELFYNDGGTTQVASPELSPEVHTSLELEHTHELAPTISVVGSLFANTTRDLIVSRGDGTARDPLRFANSAEPLVTGGFEAGIRRDWRRGFMWSLSYGYQHSEYLERGTALTALRTTRTRRHVANEPEHVASAKAVVPLLGRGLRVASRLTLEGSRWDRHESVADPEPQQKTEPTALWDLVFSGEAERAGLTWAVGVYNATGQRYGLPVGEEVRPRLVPQPGRTFLANLEITF
jgi:outer membrane receptor protein involved in Fe transport